MGKGADFERELCKRLSMWWSDGERSDIFWRSSQSGGRATQRSKSGKSTFGHCGDIAAVDPIGMPLIRAATIEAKRGYNKETSCFSDAVDKLPHYGQQAWERFVEQAEGAAARARSFSWLLIQRRDKRADLVFMPRKLHAALREQGAFAQRPTPFVTLRLDLRVQGGFHDQVSREICGMTLDHFFAYAKPEHFHAIGAQ